MALIDTMVEEVFQKQFKYRNGRYMIQSALSSPQRMQWIGSKHCAIISHRMVEKFGNDFLVEDYCCGKLYGHMFCPAIGQFTSIQKFIVPMLATIVKRFGWGKINPVVTDYRKNAYRYEFEDSPIAREIYKLYGRQETSVDSMIAGLVAGSMEHIMQKKLTAMETGCLATGENKCVFEVVSPDSAKELVSGMRGAQKKLMQRVLEAEVKHDFTKEAEALVLQQRKDGLEAEKAFLEG